MKQKPRGRLWLNDGSCIRLRPQHRNHVWSYDFVEPQTHDGRKLRLMALIDEFTRECLAIRVARRINSFGVRLLFEGNPIPMWVYDRESLRIMAVNNAALDHYGRDRDAYEQI
jgi:hypothetical protein